jgi:protein SCO1/2
MVQTSAEKKNGENSGLGAASASHSWARIPPREVIRNRYFPNVTLTTHQGKQVRLYDDMIKDRIVLLNFIFASCDRICPRVTQNLVKVQKLLGRRVGHDIFFYSFTLDPVHDSPAVLNDFATVHGIGPGWSLLTGAQDVMEMLRRRLGFTDPDPIQDLNKESHIGNVRYGNEPRMLWGACPGMSHAEFIAESISWVA